VDLGNSAVTPSTGWSRCALVWAAATVATALLVTVLLPSLAEAAAAVRVGTRTTASFDAVLVWCCAAVAAGTSAWLWAITTLVVLDAAHGQDRRRRGVPASLRRLILTGCGAVVVSGLAAPALAGGGPAAAPGAEVLAGLRLPERIAVAPLERAARLPARAGPLGVVVVRPGDTLWSIAAADLAERGTTESATPADVAAYWPQVYALNRAVVGPDPAVIEPGQRLRLPASAAPAYPHLEGDDHDEPR
jgi:nucleoid-associated protein YgaU